MPYEERQVVPTDAVETAPVERDVVATTPVQREVVETAPDAVVERRPVTRTVVSDDPVGSAWAASQMIQTIVWAIVVLVLLIVALWALHVYAGLF